MTKIGNSDSQQNQRAGSSPNDNFEQQNRWRGQSGTGSNYVGVRSSEWSPFDSAASAGGVAAFEKSFHNAFRSLDDNAESSGNQDESEWLAQAALVATAVQSLQAGLPCPITAEPQNSGDRSADVDAAVTAITAHILTSIRADAGVTGESFELNLVFAGEVVGDLGVTGITLSGTATALDVVLEWAGSEGSEGVRQAAKLLAQRLMMRFGKRTVRVFELVASRSSKPGDAVDDTVSPNET